MSAYQERDAARDRVRGADGPTWEHYIAASACEEVGYWCGSVHWVFLPSGDRPSAPSEPQVLTLSETLDPTNPGSRPPVAATLPGGEIYVLLCALLTDGAASPTPQNLEVCFVPWQSMHAYGASYNVEAVGSTPEQTGPESSMDTPARRLITTSENTRYGNWTSGSTVTGSAPPVRAGTAIAISADDLATVVNDANAYMKQNATGRCGADGLGYTLDEQCFRLFDVAGVNYQLTALEQDGEGYGFARWGWSESDLAAAG